jgi:hypothetical protein
MQLCYHPVLSSHVNLNDSPHVNSYQLITTRKQHHFLWAPTQAQAFQYAGQNDNKILRKIATKLKGVFSHKKL